MADKVKAAPHHPGDKPAEIGSPTTVGDGLDDTRREISSRPVGKVGGGAPVSKTDTDAQKALDGELPKDVFAGGAEKTFQKTDRGTPVEDAQKALQRLLSKDRRHLTEDYRGVD